jgi:hypothetical protein
VLVVERVTGQMQSGDDPLIDRSPARVNVAGDTNDPNGSNDAIFGNRRDVAAFAGGVRITKRINRAAWSGSMV